MKDREDADLVIVSVSPFGFVGDVHWPAVDDAGEAAFSFEMRVEQFVQLLGLPRIHRVPAVDFCERVDGMMHDRVDAVAAAAQLLRERPSRRRRCRRRRARTNCPVTPRSDARRRGWRPIESRRAPCPCVRVTCATRR